MNKKFHWGHYWNTISLQYLKGNMTTVCYADQRGIMGVRKTDVVIDYIAYGGK